MTLKLAGLRRTLRTVDEFLRPSRAQDRSIPVLDGGLTPNDALDQFSLFATSGIDEPDDLVIAGGAVFVSDGRLLHRLDISSGAVLASLEFENEVGALAADGGGRVIVITVAGPVYGVDVQDPDPLIANVVSNHEFECPTSALCANGLLYVTEGSEKNKPHEWTRDLMEIGSSGRVVRVDLRSDQLDVLATGLAWAAGVAINPTDSSHILVTESWRHHVIDIGPDDAQPVQLGRQLPGYPGRLVSMGGAELLLTFISLRTHLVEFVLREDEYRREMLSTIEPDYWISPALRITGERWEVLQIGSMKHLSVTKPWAPPRAYGLVAQMASDGSFSRSWHARVGSDRSGITGAAINGDRLLVACKGGRSVLTSSGSVRGNR